MDYGDPFGLILFWLCYQREIIAVALFISAFVIAGTITAHYEKKNKNKKRRRKTFKLNKIFKRKRKRSRNKRKTTRTVSRDLDYNYMMMHKQLRSELEELEVLEPGKVHTVSITSPFGTLSITRFPENPEITESTNRSKCCCAVSVYTPKSFITSANLGLVDPESKHDGSKL